MFQNTCFIIPRVFATNLIVWRVSSGGWRRVLTQGLRQGCPFQNSLHYRDDNAETIEKSKTREWDVSTWNTFFLRKHLSVTNCEGLQNSNGPAALKILDNFPLKCSKRVLFEPRSKIILIVFSGIRRYRFPIMLLIAEHLLSNDKGGSETMRIYRNSNLLLV